MFYVLLLNHWLQGFTITNLQIWLIENIVFANTHDNVLWHVFKGTNSISC